MTPVWLEQDELHGLVATFLPHDQPRRSSVALWDPESVGTLADTTLDNIEVVLADGAVHAVAARVFPLSDLLDWLVALPRSVSADDSFHSLALSARFGLDLIARGRMLPWITSTGFDAWRVDPLDAEHNAYLDRIAAATPAVAHCSAEPGLVAGTISTAGVVLRKLINAVADLLVRSPAAAAVLGNPAFADRDGLKVPHLRPWLTEVAQPYAAGCRLLISAIPPVEEPGLEGGYSDPFELRDLANFEPKTAKGGSSAVGVESANFESALASLKAGFEPRTIRPDQDFDDGWYLAFSLRSSRDRSIEVAAEDLWQRPESVLGILGDDAESEFLIGLRQAALLCPVLADAMLEPAPTGILLPQAKVLEFVESVDSLQQAGIEVRWPGYVANSTIERRPIVSAAAPPGEMPSLLDLESLLDVKWEVLLNGMSLTAAELEQLATAKQPMLKIRKQWVVLDEAQRKRLAAPPPKLSAVELLAQQQAAGAANFPTDTSQLFDPRDEIGDGDGVALAGAMKAFSDAFGELRYPEAAKQPKGLNATLRHYQREGVGWLRSLNRLGLGGVLADDMGLGKTIQVLALHAGVGGPTLVVCPTSVLVNWEREAATFVPGAKVYRFHGAHRELPKRLSKKHIVLTTYGVVRSDADLLAGKKWNLVVADEAQAMKNPRSRTAAALRKFTTGTRIALTGTPVENKLFELWSIVTWLIPGYLGNQADFRRRFVTPIERDSNEAATQRLQAMVAPILLRRKKSDPGIAPELPDKIERNVTVSLTAEQITLYRAVTKEAEESLAKAKNEISRQGTVLKMLTALKQITNHPAQYLGETEPLSNRSAKLEALLDILQSAEDNTESVLIFTQFVQMGNLISDYLAGQGFTSGFLNGSSTIAERERLVDDFQSEALPILILSLKAGGTGLNLTAASHVVHYDRWWNPAVEDQATDRAYRIGQDKVVTVHRLIAAGTVEERVALMLEAKRDLADLVLSGGERWIGSLSNEELREFTRFDEETLEDAVSGPLSSDRARTTGLAPKPTGARS